MPVWQPTPIQGPDWFDNAWSYRAAFLVVLGGESNNINHALPTDLDELWDNIADAGKDIRLTSSSSVLVPHKLDAFGTSPRGGTVQAESLGFGASGAATTGCGVMWLYWGNSDASAPGAHTPDQTSLRETSQSTCLPPRSTRVLAFRSATDGQTSLRETVRKATSEDRPITFDVTDILCSRQGQRNSRQGGGGLDLIVWSVRQGGTPVPAMVALNTTRYIETADGRHLVTVRAKGGADGSNYTGVLTLTTTDGAVFEHRILITVKDLTE